MAYNVYSYSNPYQATTGQAIDETGGIVGGVTGTSTQRRTGINTPPIQNMDPSSYPGGYQPPNPNTQNPTTQQPGGGGFNIEDFLRQMVQNWQPAQQFSFQGQQVNVPQFNPGANPFMGAGATPVAGPGAAPITGEIQSQVLQNLTNPSRYSSQLAGDTFNMLNQQIGDIFTGQRQALSEEAARRGVSFGTVPFTQEGGYADLASRQARAQSDIATNILMDQARTWSQDVNSAVQNALGYSGQSYNQGLQSAYFNQGEQQRQLDELMRRAGFNRQLGLDEFAANMGRAGFQQSEDQRMFDQLASIFGINQAAQAQNYGQQNQNIANYLGFGQQQFQNQLDTARFNAMQDDQFLQFLMQLMGAA